jgi:hypothetical protein
MSTVITAGNATNGLSLSADNTGTFQFKTGTGAGTLAMAVDASQNVIVGAGSGVSKLTVSGGDINLQEESSGRRIGFNVTNAFTSASSVTTAQYGLTWGSAGTATVGLSGFAGIPFYTNGAERMRLDSNGRLYINTTAAVGALPAYETIVGNANSISLITLQDTGTTYGSGTQYITFANSSATVAGSVQHNAAGTVNFATSSDFRLKENIVDSSDALSVVDAIKVRAFDWKEDNGHVDFGFIAQELQQHYPDAVCPGDNDAELTDPKGTWQVDYGKLTPLLLKAIQELSAKVAALEAR